MSIRTLPFEYGGLWNESFPELLVRTCTVDPATHRLGPIALRAVVVKCSLHSRMELSFWRLDVVTGWVSLDSDLAALGIIRTLPLERFHLIV